MIASVGPLTRSQDKRLLSIAHGRLPRRALSRRAATALVTAGLLTSRPANSSARLEAIEKSATSIKAARSRSGGKDRFGGSSTERNQSWSAAIHPSGLAVVRERKAGIRRRANSPKPLLWSTVIRS